METQVGNASGLPDAWMLPAAGGVGAVALVFLLGRRPGGSPAGSVVRGLIFVSLGAGMAAQGAPAWPRSN